MKIRLVSVKFLVPFVILLAAPPARLAERKQAAAALVSLRVIPEGATLWGAQASQHFLALAEYADGLERDVTTRAHFSLSEADKGEIEESGKFIARASGEVVLAAKFGGLLAETAVHIEDADKPRPFTFAREIGGILTKRGCNDTSCHGGVKGRGGFKPSVNALYPRKDYKWIVEGGTFRVLTSDTDPKIPRINLQEPEKSLLLLKPTFSVPHGGGVRFEVGSADYQTILKWIRAGAPYGEEAEQRGVSVERVEVFPKEVVLDAGSRQQLLVTAYHSNGRREDITEQVRYLSDSSGVVEVNETGLIQAKKTGQTSVLIRATGGHALSATVGVIEKPSANYPKLEARNYIDRFIFAKLRKFQILPSELSSDQEFLRRMCLDLTGTLPPPKRTREFLADKNPRKRDRLMEVLLNSPEYVDYWGFRFSDLMRVTYTSPGADFEMTKAYEDWVIDSIASNKPYDQMAREKIAAQGYSAPARNYLFHTEVVPPEVVMPELMQVFMGRRIECAQCHDHPFEAWSQNQFWGLAAFFGGTTELRDNQFSDRRPVPLIIDVLGGGHVDQPKEMTVVNPRTKEKVVPAFLDGRKLPENQWMDPRMRLAEWVTSHPYFAEATVNRIWGYFFGRGIVDPVDDFRSTNPPTHPELLEALAKDFRDSGYNLKHLMRTIVHSRTYQLSATPNESNKEDRIDYSHAQPRALEAAVLLDAITSVTGVPERFEFVGVEYAGETEPRPGARAMQMIPDACQSQFMDAFGRSMRKVLPVGPPQPNLLEELHMLAGPTYTSKISREGGRLDRLVKKGASDEQIIEEFYLAALTRLSTPREKAELLKFLDQRSSRRQETLAGLVWAIISSREFAYNH